MSAVSPIIPEKISVPKRSWFITLPPPSMVASLLTALVQRLMTCQYTAQPLMGKLLIAFIDFVSSRVAQKNYAGLISGYKSHFWSFQKEKVQLFCLTLCLTSEYRDI